MGTDVYESRYNLADLIFLLFGFPKRCDSCYHRFFSWGRGKKRTPGTSGRSRTKGSGEIILDPSEKENGPGESRLG